ncbi:MAG: AAA family ATPase, partial [Desulforhopalus sp.]
MEPLTLIGLAAAAGFVFRKVSEWSDSDDGISRSLDQRRSQIVPGKIEDTNIDDDLERIEILTEYKLVKKLVDKGFPITFVTGGAGTGKSTFVRWLENNYSGSVLLAAPTGIAAMNIGGKTLHSLFQLPLGWITRPEIKKAPYRLDIQKASLLIIDEISMVNANWLDGVSGFLRLNRCVDKPFGGIPVVMVGDLFQLPPVVTKDLVEYFERIYGESKFFAGKSLSGAPFYAVDLKKTFRQGDQDFVDILSDIREGRNLKAALKKINSTCT